METTNAKGMIARIATAALSIVIALTMALPTPAHAAECDVIWQMNMGYEKIDVSSLNYGIDRAYWGNEFPRFLRSLKGGNPCLTYFMQAYRKGGIVDHCVVRYDVPADQVPARTQRYWDEIRRICGNAHGTDYERATQVYNELKNRCTYNWNAVGEHARVSDPIYMQNCTPAAALLDGHAICAGYARACVDLFRELGLEAWTIVVGTGYLRHLIVGVNIDGLYCTCDPTNDDINNYMRGFMVLLDGNNYRGEKGRVNTIANASVAAGTTQVSQTTANEVAQSQTVASLPAEESEPVYETIQEWEPVFETKPIAQVIYQAYVLRPIEDMADSKDTIYKPIVSGEIDDGIVIVDTFSLYQPVEFYKGDKLVEKTIRVS